MAKQPTGIFLINIQITQLYVTSFYQHTNNFIFSEQLNLKRKFHSPNETHFKSIKMHFINPSLNLFYSFTRMRKLKY